MSTEPQGKRLPVFTVALMVTGNLLGAGILALPVNLGPAGMLPASLGILLVWALMLYSAFVLADQKELVQGQGGGLLTLFGSRLGPWAKWLTVAADLIILYGVLTAYLTGAPAILCNLFHLPVSGGVVTVGYFAVVTVLASLGAGLLRRFNAAILMVMGLTFLALIAMTLGHVDLERAAPMRWSFLPVSLPVVLTAFLFHNLIPTVCRELSCDRRAVRKALVIGSCIGLGMNLLWTLAVFCSLPMTGPEDLSLLHAFEKNIPATVPLSKLLGSWAFTLTGLVFAVLSISAAYMANAMGLMDFLRDMAAGAAWGRSRAVVWALTFLPPLAVALVYPDVFLAAMNLVGGVGVCLMFGIMPCLLVLKGGVQGRPRAAALVALVLFAGILVLEVAQEAGLTHIHPDVEYWTTVFEGHHGQ